MRIGPACRFLRGFTIRARSSPDDRPDDVRTANGICVLVRGRVEIGEIAAAHFDRADAKAHLAGINTIEIDQTL